MYATILLTAVLAKISYAANGLPCDGYACASYYENIGSGNSVADLKSAAKFPDSPDSIISLTSLEVPENQGEHYGVLVEAWVVAPQSGSYVFSTRSDDASEVWISTTAGEKSAEADMVKVVELTGCCVKVTGTVEVSLEVGQSYYLRAYWKEGVGRDYFQIGFTVSGQEYFPISTLGFLATTHTKDAGEVFCLPGDVQNWNNPPTLPECQAICDADSTCVAVSWWPSETFNCLVSDVCDEMVISGSGATTYRKVEKLSSTVAVPSPVAVPAPGSQDCTSGNSEFTQKMLVKMDVAQMNFGECADDISGIKTSLGRLKKVSGIVEDATDNLAQILEKINEVSDKIVMPWPVGLGIADKLGKIPKVGIFIKMGMKTIDKVLGGLETLAETIAKQASRIDTAVTVADKLFLGMKVASTPTALYLKGSHKILEAAHACGTATGYVCGTAAANMEAANEADFPTAGQQLDDIAQVGEVCHDVLSPMHEIMKSLAKIGEAIKELAEPILALLEMILEFVEYMEEQLNEFMKLLSDSDEAQCALEIFEPVTDVINLLTCPIDEVAGFFMHYIVDGIIGATSQLINKSVILGINVAVEAIVPDNLFVHIPDFTTILPVDFMVDVCDTAAVAFPEYATTVGEILALPLPMTFTGRELKDTILSDVFSPEELLWAASQGGYESACKLAWEEMGGDFDNCEKVLQKIEDALEDASCWAAEAALDVELALLNEQQKLYNAALEHFEDAQAEFVKAQNDLADAYDELDSAYDSLEDDKSTCPQCRCGGCSSTDIECHLEGVWCCPVRHGCLAALSIAQVGVDIAKGTLDVSSDIVTAAQDIYEDAAKDLTKEKTALKQRQQMAQSEADAQALICNPPMYEIVKFGDCTTHGLQYITDRKECILGGRLTAVVHHNNPEPSGNRQKWCGTFGGNTYLNFNTQTSGTGSNGHPIHQTAGTYGGQNIWQICKRPGGSLETVAAATITIDSGSSCDWGCYLDRYEDLRSAFGNDEAAAKTHFESYGFTEGRVCNCVEATPAPVGDLPPPQPFPQPAGSWMAKQVKYERVDGDQICKSVNGETWKTMDSLAACQRECYDDHACVAITWIDGGKQCVQFPSCKELKHSPHGGRTYHKVPKEPCGAKFVDNEGNVSESKRAFKIDSNTFVFGHPSDFLKMVSVDASGSLIESRFMGPQNNPPQEINRRTWGEATRGGKYSVIEVRVCLQEINYNGRRLSLESQELDAPIAA